MQSCNKCVNAKDCIDSDNYRSAESCDRYAVKRTCIFKNCAKCNLDGDWCIDPEQCGQAMTSDGYRELLKAKEDNVYIRTNYVDASVVAELLKDNARLRLKIKDMGVGKNANNV